MIFAKPVAIYLKLVAAAVVVNFFVFPFYGPGDEPGDPANLDVWERSRLVHGSRTGTGAAHTHGSGGRRPASTIAAPGPCSSSLSP